MNIKPRSKVHYMRVRVGFNVDVTAEQARTVLFDRLKDWTDDTLVEDANGAGVKVRMRVTRASIAVRDTE